jgi:hypothetical protein
MSDNELDALTANLYVDFVGRRAIADFVKESKGRRLSQVDEASDDDAQDVSARHLQVHSRELDERIPLEEKKFEKPKEFRVLRGVQQDSAGMRKQQDVGLTLESPVGRSLTRKRKIKPA